MKEKKEKIKSTEKFIPEMVVIRINKGDLEVLDSPIIKLLMETQFSPFISTKTQASRFHVMLDEYVRNHEIDLKKAYDALYAHKDDTP